MLVLKDREYEKSILKELENLKNENLLLPKKDYILRGWERCIEKGVNPNERKTAMRLSQKELDEVLKKTLN